MMRWWWTALRTIALASICVGSSAAPAAAQIGSRGGGQSPAGQPSTTAAALGPAPTVTARAAVVIDAESGAILFQKYAFDRLPPASLTKMATALVALDRAAPGTVVLGSERSAVEPSVIGLEPGDRLTLEDALYGLLLNSGNDAALAIAETVGDGSIPRFVDWMNALASGLGLTATRFANPHGLDKGNHFSTAYDMAIIARALMFQPQLRGIVGQARHDVVGPPQWAFRNTNPFLLAYAGANGIKTGYETRAGRCLAASAVRDGRLVISIVLNSMQPVADTTMLVEYGFSAITQRPSASALVADGPPVSPLKRLLRESVGAAAVAPRERSYLRGMLRLDSARVNDDPSIMARATSVFDRLRSADSRSIDGN